MSNDVITALLDILSHPLELSVTQTKSFYDYIIPIATSVGGVIVGYCFSLRTMQKTLNHDKLMREEEFIRSLRIKTTDVKQDILEAVAKIKWSAVKLESYLVQLKELKKEHVFQERITTIQNECRTIHKIWRDNMDFFYNMCDKYNLYFEDKSLFLGQIDEAKTNLLAMYIIYVENGYSVELIRKGEVVTIQKNEFLEKHSKIYGIFSDIINTIETKMKSGEIGISHPELPKSEH